MTSSEPLLLPYYTFFSIQPHSCPRSLHQLTAGLNCKTPSLCLRGHAQMCAEATSCTANHSASREPSSHRAPGPDPQPESLHPIHATNNASRKLPASHLGASNPTVWGFTSTRDKCDVVRDAQVLRCHFLPGNGKLLGTSP